MSEDTNENTNEDTDDSSVDCGTGCTGSVPWVDDGHAVVCLNGDIGNNAYTVWAFGDSGGAPVLGNGGSTSKDDHQFCLDVKHSNGEDLLKVVLVQRSSS